MLTRPAIPCPIVFFQKICLARAMNVTKLAGPILRRGLENRLKWSIMIWTPSLAAIWRHLHKKWQKVQFVPEITISFWRLTVPEQIMFKNFPWLWQQEMSLKNDQTCQHPCQKKMSTLQHFSKAQEKQIVLLMITKVSQKDADKEVETVPKKQRERISCPHAKIQAENKCVTCDMHHWCLHAFMGFEAGNTKVTTNLISISICCLLWNTNPKNKDRRTQSEGQGRLLVPILSSSFGTEMKVHCWSEVLKKGI